MKAILLRLVLFKSLILLASCQKSPPPDFSLSGINIYCVNECPPKEDIQDALDRVAYKFRNHISDPYDVWEHWSITFSQEFTCREGYQLYHWNIGENPEGECLEEDHLPVYGITRYGAANVWLYKPVSLEEGVFDWEMGNVLTDQIIHGSTEAEKIRYRTDNDLL